MLWATGPGSVDRIRAAEIDAVEAGLDDHERMTLLRERYSGFDDLAPEDRPAVLFPKMFGEICAPSLLEDVLGVARTWRPDLIVHDAAELAAPLLATLLDVPCVTHSYGAITPRERVEAAAVCVEQLWRDHGLEPRPFAGSYDGLYLDIYPASLQRGDLSHIPHVQPLRPTAYAGKAGEVVMPDGQAPLVYLTFGTVWNQNPTFHAAVEAIAAMDVRLLVTVGPNGDVDAFGPQPGNVRIDRYVAQTEVLPRCAAVVSHAGSGTMLASLALGIPQVLLPQSADQFINAEACVRVGAAVGIAPADASERTIGDAVDHVLTDGSFRHAANEVASEIASMPPPELVVNVLTTLAV